MSGSSKSCTMMSPGEKVWPQSIIVWWACMCLAVCVGPAFACCINTCKLQARTTNPTGSWSDTVSICRGDTVDLKVEAAYAGDPDENPIVCRFYFMCCGQWDGPYYYYDHNPPTSGPLGSGTYTKTISHTFDPPLLAGEEFEPKVEVYRQGHDTKNCEGTDSCKVNIVTIEMITHPHPYIASRTDSCDVTVHNGASVTFTAVPNPSGASWPPEKVPDWSIVSKPGGSSPSLSDEEDSTTTTLSGLMVNGTYVIEAESCNTRQVKVYVQDVVFYEDAEQEYGFDDHNDPSLPWKSIKKSTASETVEDAVKAKIVTSSVGDVDFAIKAGDTSIESLSPTSASSSPQTVTLTADDTATGKSEIQANDPPVNLAKMNAIVYDETDEITVKVIYISDNGSLLPNTSLLTAAPLTAYLNDDIFNQCVISFDTVSIWGTVEPVDYDKNDDDGLTVPVMDEISAVYSKKDASYDYNVFVVKNVVPQSLGEDCVRGIAMDDDELNPEYCIVQTDELTTSDQLHRLIAHELAHCIGGFDNDPFDIQNLMYSPCELQSGTLLRKPQWDDLKAGAE